MSLRMIVAKSFMSTALLALINGSAFGQAPPPTVKVGPVPIDVVGKLLQYTITYNDEMFKLELSTIPGARDPVPANTVFAVRPFTVLPNNNPFWWITLQITVVDQGMGDRIQVLYNAVHQQHPVKENIKTASVVYSGIFRTDCTKAPCEVGIVTPEAKLHNPERLIKEHNDHSDCYTVEIPRKNNNALRLNGNQIGFWYGTLEGIHKPVKKTANRPPEKSTCQSL